MQKSNMAPPALKPFTSYLPRHGFVEYAQQHLRMYVPEEQHVQVLINALPEDIREAFEDLRPEIGEEVQTICNFLDELVEEEPKKEVLEEVRNQLYSITFGHTDLRPLHSYIQRTSKLIATLFEQDCNSDLVEQIATFHCIMRMPKDLAAAFFKHLEKKKEVLCKESLHNWATRNKTSIHRHTPKIIGPSHWTIKALIGNVKLSTTMYLDSCSGFNYLSMKSCKDLGEPSLDLLDTVEIKDVGANVISCLGALVIPVVLDNIEHTCTHKLKIPQFKVAI
uniref:Vitellogenin domain-containing protein n=1 Tax=Strongyloides papillosus TaxID=174720 RepID=A0A0N5BGQ6_STREA